MENVEDKKLDTLHPPLVMLHFDHGIQAGVWMEILEWKDMGMEGYQNDLFSRERLSIVMD